jgi:predicted neutral ceramidase superfamily lipid hydrolase
MSNDNIKRSYIIKALVLLVLIPLGFYTKVYRGPCQDWIQFSFCDFLYEIFWCLLLSLLFPKQRPMVITLAVFIVTVALEFLQLWTLPFLQTIRSTFLGRTLIGNNFVWSDFIYYITGCAAGYFLILSINRKTIASRSDI